MYKQFGKDGGSNIRFGVNWNTIHLPISIFWGKDNFAGVEHYWWVGINILCFYIEYNNEYNALSLKEEE